MFGTFRATHRVKRASEARQASALALRSDKQQVSAKHQSQRYISNHPMQLRAQMMGQDGLGFEILCASSFLACERTQCEFPTPQKACRTLTRATACEVCLLLQPPFVPCPLSRPQQGKKTKNTRDTVGDYGPELSRKCCHYINIV